MAKKVVSVAIRKKKPIKHTHKIRNFKTVFKKIFNYLKSDSYMFAPFYLTSSSGEFSWELTIKKEEKKLGEDVGNYLKSDCYMYAPVVDSTLDTAGLNLGEKAKTGNVCDQVVPRTEETIRGEGNIPSLNSTMEYDYRYNPTRRIVVKHNILQKEAVKRVVQKNCGNDISSTPGEVLPQKEKGKIVVE